MTSWTRVVGLVGLLVTVPAWAHAQGGLFGPGVEVGANVALGTPDLDPDEPRAIIGPRVTLHLSPRSSLMFFGDLVAPKETFGDAWVRTRMFGVNFQRALYQTGGFSLAAVAGTGL